MTFFEVEQLYVVITTLLIGSIAATLATFCEEFYQFVLVAILYGGSSRKFLKLNCYKVIALRFLGRHI